jgi:hypothetical protein
LMDHPNNMWWNIQVMKLLIMQSSPACPFLPLTSKYSTQHPVLKHNLCSLLSVRDQVSHPYKTKDIIMVLYILIFVYLERKLKHKRLWREW